MAVVVSIGKKGMGKSTALRRLAYRLLQHRPETAIFWHDPGCQLRGGRVFASVLEARAAFAAQGMPRLSIFRGAGVDVNELAQLALEIHDVVLVLDELDRACSGKEWRAQAVKRIVHEGRAERVDLWGTFRNTRNVNEDLIGAADVIFVFHHSAASPYDLQMLRQRFGLDPDALVALPPKAFVVWSDS